MRLSERRRHAVCAPVILAVVLLTAGFLLSCSDATLESDDVYLIRVNEQIVTVADFNQALEIAKSAYPHNLSQNPVLLKEVQVGMLNQMIEELVVLQRAAELGTVLTETEVSQAIANIKADYPEGVFEQMLLEYAVTYAFWEKRLRARLMMEKVIDREVYQKITLTPEEIAEFYKENYERNHPVLDQDLEKKNINELIVKQLRRQKAEEAYRLWVKDLREKYTIDINQSEWKRLTGL